MNKLTHVINKETPAILTGISIVGLVASTLLAVQATKKADVSVEYWRRTKDYNPTKKEYISLVWPYYIPVVSAVGFTAFCMLAVNSSSKAQIASITGLYAATRGDLVKYQEKVISTIGAKKEEKIRDELSQDSIDTVQQPVVFTTTGPNLFFEKLSGRYFRSDVENVKRLVNEFNRQMLDDMYLTVNEFYDMLGLEPTDLGRNNGWDVEDGLIEVRYTAKLNKDDEPCIVLEFVTAPKPL